MAKKVIVIGSGFGGLAVACRLAARGYAVEIFEKRDKLGGRAYVTEMGGFKFDGGPTVITAPFMFDDIFKAAGRNRACGIRQLLRVDESALDAIHTDLAKAEQDGIVELSMLVGDEAANEPRTVSPAPSVSTTQAN